MERNDVDNNRPKTDNNRKRLLLLLKYLYEHTDNQPGHQASVADLIRVCEEAGINGNRNTIRDDINALLDAGYKIESITGPSNAKFYYYSERLFGTTELEALMDAVSASDTIGNKQKAKILGKISGLCSEYDADELKNRLSGSELKIDEAEANRMTALAVEPLL